MGDVKATARQEAEQAVQDDVDGKPVDWIAVARRTLGDVMANGMDRDRVNAARAFLAPAKAREGDPDDEARALGGEELQRELEAERERLGLRG